MKDKLIIIFFLYGLLFIVNCIGAESDSGIISTPVKKIIIGKIDIGPKASDISQSKIEGALNLAAGMTGKYRLISSLARDSVAALMIQKNEKPSILSVAQAMQAEQIVFIMVNRLANMLRIEISSVLSTDKEVKSKGIGYSPIVYRLKANDKPLYDPSILKATQRAFAAMEKDTDIYIKLDEPFNIKPSPTLVIGSIDYQESDAFPEWKIYDNKVVGSSEGLDTIFAVARNAKEFIVYDLQTRDSIFALFNMLIAENYRPPTTFEIDALKKLEVDNYISGTIKRTAMGADLELFLCKINGDHLDIIRSEKSQIKDDSQSEFLTQLGNLTKKLLLIN